MLHCSKVVSLVIFAAPHALPQTASDVCMSLNERKYQLQLVGALDFLSRFTAY